MLLQKYRQNNNSSRAMKNHGNTVPQKENAKSPETKLKVKEYCNLTDSEFNTYPSQTLLNYEQERTLPNSLFFGQRHTDTNTRQRQHTPKTIQVIISYEHRCKDPQQGNSLAVQ